MAVDSPVAESHGSPSSPTSVTDTPAHRYSATLADAIERQWQDYWEQEKTFEVDTPSDGTAPAKQFIMDMFPYPSGSGLHVGHPLGYIATDVFARYQRMNGHLVLHTLGYDAFGLPAEQYAVQTGQHPRVTTEKNIAAMRRQLRRLGLGHDQRRASVTTESGYVRWTQWMFLQMWDSWYDTARGTARPISELTQEFASGARPLEGGDTWSDLTQGEQRDILDGHRLAYISQTPVNWCPGLGTVLSNEEVTNEGRSERGNYPVFQRTLRQWMLRISAYADRLIDDLAVLDWPEPVKQMQRNWIGRSQGAYITFGLVGSDLSPDASLEVFTTRADTIFGATFMVIAADHPLVVAGLSERWPADTPEAWTGGHDSPRAAAAAYPAQGAASDRREDRTKTGVFTGLFAINPVTGVKIPVFAADYVLMGYGTGAIMAVPAQDQRDWDFAAEFELPVQRTIAPPEGWVGQAYTEAGPIINSQSAELSLHGLD
ncbi:MAG: class I tRNA ligase family protein, partial [Angustibacter sp.]